MNCTICNGYLFKVGVVNKHKLFKCNDCGLGVTKGDNLQKGDYHRDNTYIAEEGLFRNIFKKRVDIILRFKKIGRILEIGCSTGLMLSILKKKGLQVKGIEISSDSATVAKSRGIDVLTIPFEEVVFKESYDVIILNHTLEHLEDPKKVVKKISKILNKGGILYIDLPNFGSLSAKLLGRRWQALLPDEHLWHFTEKSLSLLLKKFDFNIIYVEKASGIWDLSDPSGELFDSFISFKKRFFVEIVTAIPSLMLTKLNLGSDLMVVAIKK